MGRTADLLLRKELQDALDEKGLVLSELTTVEDVLEYLDMQNSSLDESDFEELYTPQDWITDTMLNYPEYFMLKEEAKKKYCEEAMFYIIRQRDGSIETTGEVPDIADYRYLLETEGFATFMEKRDLSRIPISIDDIMDYLIEYWDSN